VSAPIPIEDPADARLRPFGMSDRQLRLHAAAAHGWFLAESDLVVARALEAGCRPVCALVDPARVPPVAASLPDPVFGAGDAVRRAVTRLGVVQPVLAVFERPAPADAAALATGDRLVVVQGVDNPSNVGAIVRNAAALGWDGLVLDAGSADPLARRSLRVAMGTAFSLPCARVDDVEPYVRSLRVHGVTALALTPSVDAVDLAALAAPARVAIVLGSERTGLADDVLAACTHRVRIALAPGIDSLNVAAATAIACHHLRR
jgi:tRNA G18 (ribose-2'-O)-methylase SpoU